MANLYYLLGASIGWYNYYNFKCLLSICNAKYVTIKYVYRRQIQNSMNYELIFQLIRNFLNEIKLNRKISNKIYSKKLFSKKKFFFNLKFL